jgi:hypothetical protein
MHIDELEHVAGAEHGFVTENVVEFEERGEGD